MQTATQITISKVDDFVDDGDVSCPARITSTTSGDAFFNGLVIRQILHNLLLSLRTMMPADIEGESESFAVWKVDYV
ncbi:MAG: hypothetical protein IPH52_20000 [Leptospiraceae bacterium]|nr:hypothetical protein [Leptospiraceae bacterium]